MAEAHRQIRHAEFRRRAAEDPEAVYRHREAGWSYIPVNAFADEADILARLELSPEDCRAIDGWWEIDRDQAFVSVRTLDAAESWMRPGLYARNRGHAAEFIDLMAIVDAKMITRAVYEDALSRFAEIGFPVDPRFLLDASRSYKPV